MEELYKTLALAIISLLLLLAGYYGSYYLIFKKKLSEFREKLSKFSPCLESVDEALKDDKVSEEEFRIAWDRCYTFFKNLRG